MLSMMAVGAGSVTAKKSSSPAHLDHLLAGTLKDEVKRREKRRKKEQQRRRLYNDRRRSMFRATTSVEHPGTPESDRTTRESTTRPSTSTIGPEFMESRKMASQRLRFSLTAYDPTPSDVSLAFDEKNCTVESTSGANVSVEEYKTTPEGTPSEIYLKVTPEPIAFVMKFVDGKMMIEFKGSWAAFQVAAQTQEVVEQQIVIPAPANTASDELPAFSQICLKVHFVEEDVDAHDIRIFWDQKELSAPEGAPYTIVYQADHADGGRQFVIAFPHPLTGELFILRGIIKGDRITILNTDKYDQEHIKLYISFYIKDPELQIKILQEIEANPTYAIMILYKYGVFAEAIDIPSLVPHIVHEDKENKPIKNKDKEDDEHVKKNREAQKKAEEKGKKGTEAPKDGKDWSCGKVKWDLPKEEKKFRDVGKLKIPEFGPKEEGPHTKEVGKLKWSGFDQEEPKEVVKQKPKVGKLKLGAFGAPPAEETSKPAPKKTWKKKE